MTDNNPYEAPATDSPPVKHRTPGPDGNPYEAPATDLQTPDGAGNPQGVETGRGIAWISESFGLFKQSPLAWVIIVIVLLLIQIVLASIPFLGQLASHLTWPVFAAGFMAGCAALDDGDELSVRHLFAGFSTKLMPLLGLGVMYLVMTAGIVLIAVALFFVMGGTQGLAGMADGAGGPTGEAMGDLVVIGSVGLVSLALFVPVLMAIWFAPVLVMLGNKGVLESLKLSFTGCLKNILPFLVYGIAMFVLLIIALIPFGLGLLIMFPVYMATPYVSCKDIYGA